MARGGTRTKRDTPTSPAKARPQPATNSRSTTRTGKATRNNQLSPELQDQQDAELQNATLSAVAQDAASIQFQASERDSIDHTDQGELAALDPDLIIETLPSLYEHSLKIISVFDVNPAALDNVLQDIRSHGPAFRKLNMQVKHFSTDREAFGGALYIHAQMIAARLFGGFPENEGPWRPDPLIQLANLACFLSTLLAGEDEMITAHLEEVYASFPADFAASLGKFATTDALRPSTLSLSIYLRTQLFIREIAKFDPTTSPEPLLKDIFMQDENTVRGEDMADQHADNYQASVMNEMDDIRQYIAGNQVDVDGLTAVKPWHNFQGLLTQWVLSRRNELQAQVEFQGGITGICDRLASRNFNPAPHLPPKTKRGRKSNGTPGRAAVKSSLDPKEIASFKALQANIAATQAQYVSRARIDPRLTAMDNTAQPHPEEIAESITGENNQTSFTDRTDDQIDGILMPSLTQQTEQANKENKAPEAGPSRPRSFMDRQANATRIPAGTSPPLNQNNKRNAFAMEEDDDDADAGFEVDTRVEKRPRLPQQRGQIPNNYTPEPSGTAGPSGTYSTQDIAGTQMSPPKSQLLLDIDPNSVPPSTYEHHRLVQNVAKQHVALRKELSVTQNNIYQERRAWTEAETNRLLILIERHGSKWSKMKADDANRNGWSDRDGGPNVLENRGQVSLKDKARNMKMDYLKARMALPEGFAAVSIGARLVNVLREMDIDYVEGGGRGTDLVGGAGVVHAGTGVGGGYAEEE